MRTGEIREGIPGEEIFRLMDTLGMDLSLQIDLMREAGVWFDLEGFIRAAKASGNYSEYRVSVILLQEAPEEIRLMIPRVVERVWRGQPGE